MAFAHPLVWSAVYGDLSAARRRELHARAASLTSGERALAHRVAAAAGPDDGSRRGPRGGCATSTHQSQGGAGRVLVQPGRRGVKHRGREGTPPAPGPLFADHLRRHGGSAGSWLGRPSTSRRARRETRCLASSISFLVGSASARARLSKACDADDPGFGPPMRSDALSSRSRRHTSSTATRRSRSPVAVKPWTLLRPYRRHVTARSACSACSGRSAHAQKKTWTRLSACWTTCPTKRPASGPRTSTLS